MYTFTMQQRSFVFNIVFCLNLKEYTRKDQESSVIGVFCPKLYEVKFFLPSRIKVYIVDPLLSSKGQRRHQSD